MEMDSFGNIYLGTDQGIAKSENNGFSFKIYNHLNGVPLTTIKEIELHLPTNTLFSIYFDDVYYKAFYN